MVLASQEKIAFGSDHAGFALKQQLISFVQSMEVLDCGCFDKNSCDYPDFANRVADTITKKEAKLGVLICGTGIGMSIAANRIRGIRAALCYDEELTYLARAHNNANIICLGARFIQLDKAISLLKVFLETEFMGGRHSLRITKIDKELANV